MFIVIVLDFGDIIEPENPQAHFKLDTSQVKIENTIGMSLVTTKNQINQTSFENKIRMSWIKTK